MKNTGLIFLGLISVVALFAMLASVDMWATFGPAVIQPQVPKTKTLLIKMPFGGRLGQFVPGFPLGGGTAQTGEGRTDYTDTIQFNVAGFQGISTDYRTLDFPTQGSPTEAMYCLGGSQDVWAEYRLDIGSGLRSKVDTNTNELVSYRNEKIKMLAGIFTFVAARISDQAPNGVLELRLMGPGGLVVFEDNPYDTTFTPFGTKINGVNVPISVQMIGSYDTVMNRFVLVSIVLQFQCQGLSGELEVPKMGCLSKYLQYPLVNPEFDLCLLGTDSQLSTMSLGAVTGMAAVSGADFALVHRGSRRIDIKGNGYKIPFLYLQGGVLNPGKDASQQTWWVEQGAGANWITPNDYFIVNSRQDDRAEVRVYQFRGADTNNNNIEIRDARGKTHHVPFNAATGDCLNTIITGGQGAICNYNAAMDALAVDQNSDGTYNGNAGWVTPRNLMINLGNQNPGAATTITYTMLSRRIPEGGPNVVETTTITGNDPIEQRITNSATCPTTPDYNYGCMGLAGFFNLDDREHGGDIFVGGSTSSVPGPYPSAGQAGTLPTYQSSKGGWTNIVLTFEASRLKGK